MTEQILFFKKSTKQRSMIGKGKLEDEIEHINPETVNKWST